MEAKGTTNIENLEKNLGADVYVRQFKASNSPFGITFNGGKASTLGQNPRFKVVQIDYDMQIPWKITVYEYNIDVANRFYANNPNGICAECIKKVREYPKDFKTSKTKLIQQLSPLDMHRLAKHIREDEKAAVDFINKMCETCNIGKNCDETCRKNLYCILNNADQDSIIECR